MRLRSVHLTGIARIATIKLSGDPNNPLRMLDTATADELKAEIMKHLKILASVLDFEPLMALADGSATSAVPQARAASASDRMKKRPARRGDQCLAGAPTET